MGERVEINYGKSLSTTRQLFEELLSEVIKKNYQEQISDLTRRLDVVQGNLENETKRRIALERYLKLDYQPSKYVKKK